MSSDLRVAILSPLGQALGARLRENPIGLSDQAIAVDDPVPVGCPSASLEGLPAIGVGLSQVEQEGGPVAPDHPGALQEQLGDSLSIAQERSEAGGGKDGKHLSVGGGAGSVGPLD
jgi:hypothetical protein